MLKYTLRRLALLIPTLLGISLLTFGLMRFLPGDVISVLVGPELVISDEQRATLLRMFGLDVPIHIQYLRWLIGVLGGDLGVSLRTSEPVTELIAQRLAITVELAILTAVFTWLLAIPLGVFAAVRRNTVWDLGANVLGLIGLSLPNFWVAVLLLLVTSLFLRWQPPAVWSSLSEDPVANLKIMILPVFSLSIALVAIGMRMTRSSMLEVLGQDYIRTARAKGLSEPVTLVRHALKNAAIPIVTVLGIQFGNLLGGTVIVEKIFGLPGIGWMILTSITQRDYPVVQGTVLFVAVVFVLVNLFVDLLYAYLDPRIRYG